MQFVIFRGDSTSLRRRDCKKGLSFNNIYSEEQGMAQCWDNSPPTIVAQVQIPASTPYVGWSSLLLVLSLVPRGFSPGSPVRPLSLKPTLPTDTFKRVHKNSRVLRNKLLFTKFFFFFFSVLWCFTLHLYATFLSASFHSIKKVCFLSIYLDHRVRTEALGCTKAHQKAIQRWPLLQNNEHFMWYNSPEVDKQLLKKSLKTDI